MTVRIFVPDVPELMPLIEGARAMSQCAVREPNKGYWRIEAEDELRFERKALGLSAALWNSALMGGFCGRIVEYGRDTMQLQSEA